MTTFLYQWGRVKRILERPAAARRSAACFFSATLVLLSGCDEERVSGQVVAVVNGEEITAPELNEEARARGLVIGNDPWVRDAVLQDLLERKLLVQAAKRRKLDQTPEYLLAQRRSNELLVVSELVQALDGQRTDPSESELAQFIWSHPFAFDRRALLSVDQIRAQEGLDPDLAHVLAETQSLDRAQSLLASNGVRAERRIEVWDSATLSPEIAEQLMSHPDSGTVLFELPDQTIVARVLKAIPQPTPPADRLHVARELLRSEWSRQSLKSVLTKETSKATIRYQRRFSPRKLRPGLEAARPGGRSSPQTPAKRD